MRSFRKSSLTAVMVVLSALLLLPVLCLGAGTVTYTIQDALDGKARFITFSATADASAHTYPDTSTTIGETAGYWLCSMETDPGSTAPTDDYDITVKSALGTDLLGGAGANRDETNTEIAYPTIDSTSGQKGCVPINSALTLGISGNGVDSATTTIKLDLRRQ